MADDAAIMAGLFARLHDDEALGIELTVRRILVASDDG
jgi:hypothetical protein